MTDTATDRTVPTWTLGDRLRKARKHAHLGSQGMADTLGCHRNTIINWEVDRTTPTIDVIVRWSKATGVPVEWIIGDYDPDAQVDDVVSVTDRYRTDVIRLAA